MNKYTRGQWIVKHIESKNAFNVVGTALGGNRKIARCPYVVTGMEKTDKREKEEAEANAKLISAAPDLLEALQNIENDDNSIPAHAWHLVQKAIKKATD